MPARVVVHEHVADRSPRDLEGWARVEDARQNHDKRLFHREFILIRSMAVDRRRSDVTIAILFQRRQGAHRRLIADRTENRDEIAPHVVGLLKPDDGQGYDGRSELHEVSLDLAYEPIGVDKVDEAPKVGDVALL